jgi:hypothetical protein
MKTLMNRFARFAQQCRNRERVICPWNKYKPHEFYYHLYDHLTPPYCRYCEAELFMYDSGGNYSPHFGTCIKPRWSIRLLGRLGGLGKYWWKIDGKE